MRLYSFVLLLLLPALASCTLQIVSVSSFVPCVNGSVNTGGGITNLNCVNTGLTTIVNAFLSSTVQGDINPTTDEPFVTDQAGVFEAQLTVVPPTAADQADSTSQCQSTGGQGCQTTVPVALTVEELPPIFVYNLQEIPSRSTGSLRAPYANLYGLRGEWALEGLSVTESADYIGYLQPANPTPTCQLQSTTGLSNIRSFYPAQVNLTRIFDNSTLNDRYLGCRKIDDDTPIPVSRPPAGIGLSGTGTLLYSFRCQGLFRGGAFLPFTGFFDWNLYAQGLPVAPPARIYSISNPGVPVTAVRINATLLEDYPSLGLTKGQQETLTLTTRQNGLIGTSAVSTPGGYIAASIIDVVTPSGSLGPFLQGLLVTANGGDLNLEAPLNMTPNAGGINPVTVGSTGPTAPLLSPNIANPWWYDPDTGAPFGRGKMPIARSMRFMTNNDTHSLMYFLRTNQYAGVSRECGGMCVDPNIYQHPPPVLAFTGLIGGQRNFVFNFVDLLPLPQINYLNASAGPYPTAGSLGRMLTCFPNKGLNYLDVDITMPCEAAADMQEFEDTVAGLLANGSQAALAQIDRLVPPHMPDVFDVLRPNLWVYNQQLYYQPVPGRGSSTGNIRLNTLISFSGDFAGYAQSVPNGQLQLQSDNPDLGAAQSPTTYCTAAWTAGFPNAVQGQVSYLACNPTNTTTQTASYSVRSRCGLNSLFTSVDGGSYLAGPDAFSPQRSMSTVNTPVEAELTGVTRGTCKGPNAGGFLFFNGAFTMYDTVKQQSVVPDYEDIEAAGISCLIELYSTQSLVPGTVLLSRQKVDCSTVQYPSTGAPPFVLPSPRNVPTLAGITVTPTQTPIIRATPTPKNPEIVQRALGGFILLGIILVALVCCICACFLRCVNF